MDNEYKQRLLLGRSIKVAEKISGLTRQEICDSVGIDPSYYWRIKEGKSTPSIFVYDRIKTALTGAKPPGPQALVLAGKLDSLCADQAKAVGVLLDMIKDWPGHKIDALNGIIGSINEL